MHGISVQTWKNFRLKCRILIQRCESTSNFSQFRFLLCAYELYKNYAPKLPKKYVS